MVVAGMDALTAEKRPPEDELFPRALAGHRSAIEAIHESMRAMARQVCSRTPASSSVPEWEDLAQEAARRFFSQGIHRYRGAGSERAYLYSVVKTTWLEMLRSQRRRVAREQAQAPAEAVSYDIHARLDVERILAGLDESCRDLLVKVFLYEVAYSVLSLRLGLKESSVRARVSRCVERARRLV